MEEKKSPKANLENKKLMFIQIGLIISLILAWVVFEIKSYDKRELADIGRTVEIVEEEMVEIRNKNHSLWKFQSRPPKSKSWKMT